MRNDIKAVARQISDLEDDIANEINIEENMKEIQRLTNDLTVDEMIAIDQYLMGEKIF